VLLVQLSISAKRYELIQRERGGVRHPPTPNRTVGGDQNLQRLHQPRGDTQQCGALPDRLPHAGKITTGQITETTVYDP
jgi:hypothetical protein